MLIAEPFPCGEMRAGFPRPRRGSAADEGISPPRVAAHRLSLDQGRGDQAPEGWDAMSPARLWERALGMREGQRVPGGGHVNSMSNDGRGRAHNGARP